MDTTHTLPMLALPSPGAIPETIIAQSEPPNLALVGVGLISRTRSDRQVCVAREILTSYRPSIGPASRYRRTGRQRDGSLPDALAHLGATPTRGPESPGCLQRFQSATAGEPDAERIGGPRCGITSVASSARTITPASP